MSDEKVIGYFAMKSRSELVCDGDALIVVGSHATLKRMLAIDSRSTVDSYRIEKARFGEILSGLERGGAYAFDAESYRRFAPLAKAAGVSAGDYDFAPATPDDIMLVTVTIPFARPNGAAGSFAGAVKAFAVQSRPDAPPEGV